MNKTFKLSSLVMSGLLIGNIQIASAFSLGCEEYIGCEKKFCEIEKQITIAKSKVTTKS